MDSQADGTDHIPLAVRAACTKLQKDPGYGKDYHIRTVLPIR